jgi:3-deoxy-D-manno-octulosonate 8-phosphate phosphatase (KDO 8-P phosphatase)
MHNNEFEMKKIEEVDFSKISFVLLDLDGVLTDGSLPYLPTGEVMKVFHVHDGYGIARGRHLGLKFGIISGSSAAANTYRSQRLKLEELYQDCADKAAAYEEIRKKYDLQPENFCFIGDDVFDLPLLRIVAFSCAPPQAIEEVRKDVHYITKIEAGKGAVREVIDLILRKKGLI